MANKTRRHGSYLKLIFASSLLVVVAYPVQAQSTSIAKAADTEEEIRLLKEEVRALRSEMNSLKQELHRGSMQSGSTAYPADRKSREGRAEAVAAGTPPQPPASRAGQSNSSD